MTTKLELTAFHEAGHALSCEACGVAALECTIVPEGKTTLGHVQHWKHQPLINIVIALSGPLAEGVARGMPLGTYKVPGASKDLAMIDEDLTAYHGKPLAREQSRLFQEAMEIAKSDVRKLWPSIQHLACWLLCHETASRDFVEAVYENFTTKYRNPIKC